VFEEHSQRKLARSICCALGNSLWTFWVGGFSFYIAVVVPVGGAEIGPDLQGLVTAQITMVINIGGLIFGFAWLLPHWQPNSWTRYRQFCASTLVLISGWLCFHRLDVIAEMDGRSVSIFQGWSFYGIHRFYIWLTLLQWLAALGIHFSFELTRNGEPAVD
jgi:hypothetical protein